MPVCGGDLGIFPGQNALDHHFHLGHVAQPLDVIPGHGGRLDVGQPADRRPRTWACRAARPQGWSCRDTPQHCRVSARAHPERSLLVAAAVAIDRDGDGDRALPLHAQDVVLRHVELVGRIKLRPDRPAACRDHIGDRRRRLGRQDHQMIADPRRPRDARLAVRMIAFVSAGRVDDDRRLVFLAENLRAHVDLAHVDQPARTQLEFQETLAVGTQRDVVIDAGSHVAEMGRWHVLVHHRFEIEHVERFLRACDQVRIVTRRPHIGIGREFGKLALLGERRKARAGKQRARGQKFDEVTAARLDRRCASCDLLPECFFAWLWRILSGGCSVANRMANLPSLRK